MAFFNWQVVTEVGGCFQMNAGEKERPFQGSQAKTHSDEHWGGERVRGGERVGAGQRSD